jgi:hypothetical protein
MPLTDTQKAEIKKHLGLLRSDGLLDSVFKKIDADSSWLAEITTSLTLCNTQLTAYQQAKIERQILFQLKVRCLIVTYRLAIRRACTKTN